MCRGVIRDHMRRIRFGARKWEWCSVARCVVWRYWVVGRDDVRTVLGYWRLCLVHPRWMRMHDLAWDRCCRRGDYWTRHGCYFGDGCSRHPLWCGGMRIYSVRKNGLQLTQCVQLFLTDLAERCCWARVLESCSQLRSRLDGNLGGRLMRHGNVTRKKFDCVRNALTSRFRRVYSVASVVIESRAEVPCINPMRCPCTSLARLFVRNDFNARWC